MKCPLCGSDSRMIYTVILFGQLPLIVWDCPECGVVRECPVHGASCVGAPCNLEDHVTPEGFALLEKAHAW